MPQLIALLVAVIVTVGYHQPRIRSRVRAVEHLLHEAFRRPAIGWLLAGFLSLVVNWQLTMRRGIPDPIVHDEFSYLLAADTFAHGRLTTPTHPLWRFFETFHVLQRPTYMSKYPPGHGLVMALGQRVGGDPILGVWLEAALVTFCAGWMLFGFVMAPASVLGAVVVALDPLLLQWSSHYWGGSLAAAGGCLVVGAWVRLFRVRRWKAGTVLGIGIAILTFTRPYEGLLFASPFVAWGLIRPRAGMAAAAIVLAVAGTWTLYDNHRVTGHAFELPYTAYERQYALAPSFLWQSVRPDHPFVRPSMRDYAVEGELPHYYGQRSVRGFLEFGAQKLLYLLVAMKFIWISAALMLWLPGAVAGDRRLKWALAAAALVLAGTLASNWTRTQYVAPAAPVLLLLGVAALCRGVVTSPSLARGIGVGVLAGMIAQTVEVSRVPATHTQRGEIQRQLVGQGTRHLVFVRYLPGHRADGEFVYNLADIDQQPVVWAMDRGVAEDQQAIRYFAGRNVWLCTVDAEMARITPMTAPSDVEPPFPRKP